MIELNYYAHILAMLFAALSVIYVLTQGSYIKKEYSFIIFLQAFIMLAMLGLHFYHFSILQDIVTDFNASLAALQAIPIELKYIYWGITTPLLLIMFPILMDIKKVSYVFVFQLVIVNTLMLTSGYISESSLLASKSITTMGIAFFGIGIMFYIYLIYSIYHKFIQLKAEETPRKLRDTIAFMLIYIIFAWTIYPISYLIQLSAYTDISFTGEMTLPLKTFMYTLGDFAAKVFYGLFVIGSARALSEFDEKQ